MRCDPPRTDDITFQAEFSAGRTLQPTEVRRAWTAMRRGNSKTTIGDYTDLRQGQKAPKSLIPHSEKTAVNNVRVFHRQPPPQRIVGSASQRVFTPYKKGSGKGPKSCVWRKNTVFATRGCAQYRNPMHRLRAFSARVTYGLHGMAHYFHVCG